MASVTKRFRNKETGESQLFTKINGKWIPTIEHERQKIAEQTGGLEAFAIGGGKRFNDLLEGLDDLAGTNKYDGGDGTGYAELKEARPFTTGAGEAVSEIAQMALPAGAAAKAMKAKNMFAGSPILAATVADMTGASGMAGLRAPEEGGSRAENAGSEALWSLLGGGLTKALSGVRPSEAGRAALDRGEYLTPGYASDNHILEGLESAMEVVPGLAHATKRARGRAQQDWRNSTFNTVAKKLGIKTTGETGIDSFKQIDDVVTAGYKNAFNDIDTVPKSVFDSMFKTIARRSSDLGVADQAALRDVAKKLRRFRTKVNKGKSTDLADRIDYFLRNEASSAQGPLRDAIIDLKRTYHRGFGPELTNKLNTLDEVFPDVVTLQDAVSRANREMQEGGFSPQQLMASSDSASQGKQFARGESALFDQANMGGKTVGKKEGGQPLEWFRRLAGAAPSPPGMEMLGNAVIGNTEAHKLVKDLPSLLLETANPSRVMPASSDDEEDNLIKLLREMLGT